MSIDGHTMKTVGDVIELVINIIALFFIIIMALFTIINTAISLTYRINVQIIVVGNLMACLQRLYYVFLGLNNISNDNVTMPLMITIQQFGAFVEQLGWITLVFDRMIATFFTTLYINFTQKDHILYSITSYVVVFILSLFYLFIKPSELIGFILELSAVIFETFAVLSLMHYNRWQYNKRHHSMIPLSKRHHLRQNWFSTKYVVPAYFMKIVHTVYQLSILIFTRTIIEKLYLKEPYITISLVKSIPASIYRAILFMYCVLNARMYRKLRDKYLKKKTETISSSMPEAHVENTKNHFRDLQNMWK